MVYVAKGDIAQVKADALITAINSGGMWFGGIDGVIGRVAGRHFHNYAVAASPLKDGQTVVAPGVGATNTGKFANVVFVVDDLEVPLRNVVRNGLVAAAKAGFKSVTLPTIRMGVMLGAVEKTPQEAVNEMATGVVEALAAGAVFDSITFVVYGNDSVVGMLERTFAKQ